MQAFISTKEELQEAVNQAVETILIQKLPSLIRRSTRKNWLTTEDLIELTGWSRRTIQYLRDQRRIPFSQEGRRILYPTDGIEEYLRSNQIEPLEKW